MGPSPCWGGPEEAARGWRAYSRSLPGKVVLAHPESIIACWCFFRGVILFVVGGVVCDVGGFL
eukprot:12272163-Prorocentrum_lima.AAC.1